MVFKLKNNERVLRESHSMSQSRMVLVKYIEAIGLKQHFDQFFYNLIISENMYVNRTKVRYHG